MTARRWRSFMIALRRIWILYVCILLGHYQLKGSLILEIGSGVGYIMKAAQRRFHPSQIVGLDVAPEMGTKAEQRLNRDHVVMPAEFVVYDGVRIPIRSASIDFVYSVACLQHVPKPYVYNLLDEVLRLKPRDSLLFISYRSWD